MILPRYLSVDIWERHFLVEISGEISVPRAKAFSMSLLGKFVKPVRAGPQQVKVFSRKY